MPNHTTELSGCLPCQPFGGRHRSAITSDVWRSCYLQHIHQINTAWHEETRNSWTPSQKKMLPENRQIPGCFLHYKVNMTVSLLSELWRQEGQVPSCIHLPIILCLEGLGRTRVRSHSAMPSSEQEHRLWTLRNSHRAWQLELIVFTESLKKWTRLGFVPLRITSLVCWSAPHPLSHLLKLKVWDAPHFLSSYLY